MTRVFGVPMTPESTEKFLKLDNATVDMLTKDMETALENRLKVLAEVNG